MKKYLSLMLASVLFSSCSLVAPYTITFTTDDGVLIDPNSSTIDFVVSQPTLAYISSISCDGSQVLDFLPIVNDEMEVSTVHKLPLTALVDQMPGVTCKVTVTVFDRTTTSQASASINVLVPGDGIIKSDEDLTEEADDELFEDNENVDGEEEVDGSDLVEGSKVGEEFDDTAENLENDAVIDDANDEAPLDVTNQEGSASELVDDTVTAEQ